MISSQLNRHGLRTSLLLKSQTNSLLVYRKRFHRIPVSSPLSSVSASLGLRHPAFRSLSTSNNSPKTDNSKHVPEPVPANLTRKPKVELKPAPIKPQKSTMAAPSSPALPGPPQAQNPTEPSSETSSATSDSGTSSVLDTTKADFEDASRHGILVPPPKDASWIGGLVHQAKELFKFYWRGVKLINTNRLRVKEMQERVKNGGPPLLRWEMRFIRTNKDDLVKLVPFALIFIVLEEIIPLVVLYAPFLLPSTCILPSQKERIANKRRDKQKLYTSTMVDDFQELYQRVLTDKSVSINKLLSGSTPLSLTGVLGLSTVGPRPLRIRRIKNHLNIIREDDALLLRENAISSLRESDLRDALEERGLLTDGCSRKQLESRLQWWIDQTRGTSLSDNADPVRDRIILVARAVTGKL